MLKPLIGDLVVKQGAVKTLRYERKEICKDCNGDGIKYITIDQQDDKQPEPCQTCQTTGKVICESIINIFPSTIRKP